MSDDTITLLGKLVWFGALYSISIHFFGWWVLIPLILAGANIRWRSDDSGGKEKP